MKTPLTTSIMLAINVSHVIQKWKDVQNARSRTMVQTSFAQHAIMPTITKTEHVSTAAHSIMHATVVIIEIA